MISPAVRPLGIGPLFTATVLAVLLVQLAMSPSEVSSHDCDPAVMDSPDMHTDFQGTVCSEPGHDKPHINVIEVDGGRDNKLVFRVDPPPAVPPETYLGDDDQIRIKLRDFRIPADDIVEALIVLSDSGVPPPATSINPGSAATDPDDPEILVLTLDGNASALAADEGEHLIITIDEGTGILAPETPRGFQDPTLRDQEDGYPVEITFVDSQGNPDIPTDNENYVVVKNPVSSTEPGATVRVELATYAPVDIGGNEEITVDFSGPSDDTSFDIPSTISASRIKIRTRDANDEPITFDPADVLVQGERVILTVPEDKVIEEGDFVISFSQLARIKNPFVAGNRVITVSSSVPDFRDDEITAVIRRSTTIDPSEGPRGSEFTLEGKGYQQGTVTIFEGDDDIIDPGETLASVPTSRGAFSLTLDALGRRGSSEYRVYTRDSYGVVASVSFDITGSIELEPSVINVGTRLRVTFYDWGEDHSEVAAVRISGIPVLLPSAITEFENCYVYAGLPRVNHDRTVSLVVTVPDGVPPGEQLVSVYDQQQLDHKYFEADKPFADLDDVPDPEKMSCADLVDGSRGSPTDQNGDVVVRLKPDANANAVATIEIASEDLILSPTIAARGQRVTIVGSGFNRSPDGRADITGIWIGTHRVENQSGFEVGTNGVFTATATVPLNIREGSNEVRVVGWDDTVAQAFLTIPQPTLSLEPESSGRGSQVTLTGAGFVAGRTVRLHYGEGVGLANGDRIVGAVMADGSGGFTGSFDVPYSATVGRTHLVTAVSLLGADSSLPSVEAMANHTVADASASTSPASVTSGDIVTIEGSNFPAFTLVTHLAIGGVGVVPRQETVTDRDGSFEAEVLVPQLELGDQILRVQVGREVAIHVIKIVDPPLSGPTSEVFKVLIRRGVLDRIWHLDSATQSWTFFDPSPEFREFSTLNSVERGDILFVHLRAPLVFQGAQLEAAWNHIALK